MNSMKKKDMLARKQMHILWINKITDKEYWRTTQLELTKSLKKRGNQVTLVMAKNIGENKTKEDDIIYLPTVPNHLFSGLIFGLVLLFYFPLMIRKKKIDIIMIDVTSIWLPFTITLKLLSNVPIVTDIRDFAEKNKNVVSNISFFLIKYIADGITTITPQLKEILVKKYHLNDKNIEIWSSGVSIDIFNKKYQDININNEGYSKKFVLLHHGSYGPGRGIENLILALNKLNNDLKKRVKLILIGILPKDQERFLRLCEEANVKDRVDILPIKSHEKIPFYIQISNVGIIPLNPEYISYQVSVPLKTLEYMAMGKPIIATNIPFHQRIFEKGECGILINANTPEVLANAITEMYENKDKMETMGKIGKKIILEQYTWDKVAFTVEKIIKNILQGYYNEKQ